MAGKPEYGVIDTMANFFRDLLSPIGAKGKGRGITGGSANMSCSNLINREITGEKMSPEEMAALAKCKNRANPGASELESGSEDSAEGNVEE